VAAAYGGWRVHHVEVLNNFCNAEVANPTHGFVIPAQCVNIVWPYAEGFALLIAGAVFVFAGLILTRRMMSSERQYLKDLKAGKYDRDNDHHNADDFNLQIPTLKMNASLRGGLYDEHLEE
jgi:hypothetical protein